MNSRENTSKSTMNKYRTRIQEKKQKPEPAPEKVEAQVLAKETKALARQQFRENKESKNGLRQRGRELAALRMRALSLKYSYAQEENN